MACYFTRFVFAENNPFSRQLIPVELTAAKALANQTNLLTFWFHSGYRELVAVWDAVSEQAIDSIVAEVTRLGSITAETVCVFSDEELAQRGPSR